MAELQNLRFDLLVWLVLTFIAGAITLALWFWFPRVRHQLLPPQRLRAVPWTGPQILVLLILIYIFWPACVADLLNRTGFFTQLYGEAPDVSGSADEENNPDSDAATDATKLRSIRQSLWIMLFAFPFQVLSLPLFLWLASGTRPYQLGLTLSHAGSNLALGFLGWLILTPLVNALNTLVVWCSWSFLHTKPEDHPLTRLTRDQPLALEWGVLVLSAVLVAPVLEELVFRGLLQAWFARRPWSGAVALLGALAMALLARVGQLRTGLQERDLAVIVEQLQPALFVLVMALGYLWVHVRARTPAAGAIYGTALLFALSHAFAWPTPIALFVLGLGLGYLAYRTQSLLGPIVLHALFNGVACVLLLYPHDAQPSRPARGNATTSAGQLPCAVTAVSGVPGSW